MKAKTPKPSHPPLLRLVCRALDDKKAEDLRVLSVKAQSSITDYLVVATGTSDPHLRALRVELEKIIDAERVNIVGMDTSEGSGWVVIDAFDIMIHVFTPEMRDKYALENLWKDAETISLGELEKVASAPKPRKKATVVTPAKKRPPKKKAE